MEPITICLQIFGVARGREGMKERKKEEEKESQNKETVVKVKYDFF